jgi:hypothetical protein
MFGEAFSSPVRLRKKSSRTTGNYDPIFGQRRRGLQEKVFSRQGARGAKLNNHAPRGNISDYMIIVSVITVNSRTSAFHPYSGVGGSGEATRFFLIPFLSTWG